MQMSYDYEHSVALILVITEHPVESIIQYRFSNRDVLNEALLAAGAPNLQKDIDGDVQGNKRLALLEHTVLEEAVLQPWYSSGESTSE
jgi:ribonuclease-3